jgi:hypothetical protein
LQGVCLCYYVYTQGQHHQPWGTAQHILSAPVRQQPCVCCDNDAAAVQIRGFTLDLAQSKLTAWCCP